MLVEAYKKHRERKATTYMKKHAGMLIIDSADEALAPVLVRQELYK